MTKLCQIFLTWHQIVFTSSGVRVRVGAETKSFRWCVPKNDTDATPCNNHEQNLRSPDSKHIVDSSLCNGGTSPFCRSLNRKKELIVVCVASIVTDIYNAFELGVKWRLMGASFLQIATTIICSYYLHGEKWSPDSDYCTILLFPVSVGVS